MLGGDSTAVNLGAGAVEVSVEWRFLWAIEVLGYGFL